jgi:REP element-mobilizing transposase RayT
MTTARAQLINNENVGVYHCVQRCVRRAWLCGVDDYTGQSYEHRKAWVEKQIALIGSCFAVAIHAYAVMSNHLHVVLQIDPKASLSWTDQQIAERWVRLFPPRELTDQAIKAKQNNIMANADRLAIIRNRLGNLSWLMKCLAEPIARRANTEDACKGRFWEGRFKAQVLKDEKALYAAMAYVDLNPIRAGISKRIEDQRHTSVRKRIKQARKEPKVLGEVLQPMISSISTSVLNFKLRDYLELIEWTGKQVREGKSAKNKTVPYMVKKLDSDSTRWPLRVKAIGSNYWRVVAEAQDLVAIAKDIGQKWLRGIRFAATLERIK